jgi:hypothetical protein
MYWTWVRYICQYFDVDIWHFDVQHFDVRHFDVRHFVVRHKCFGTVAGTRDEGYVELDAAQVVLREEAALTFYLQK